MRIVLDTNVLVRANAKARGPARELLQLIIGSAECKACLKVILEDALVPRPRQI